MKRGLHVARPQGDRIVDDQGRTVLLRGVNYSERAKAPPFAGWHAPASWDLLRRSGVSVVRYLIIWEALEPAPGQYDAGYLADVRAQLDEAEARGIRVVLDMHQDLWGRPFGGDGAPDWATVDSPLIPNKPVGFPLNYVNPEVIRNFDRFWKSASLQESFRDAWLAAIAALSSSPAVCGYDLFNEPFPGLATPGGCDRGRLSDFYDGLVPAVNAADPDALVMVQANLFTSFGCPSRLRPLPYANVVYAPHWYDAVLSVRRTAGLPEFDGGSRARSAAGLDAHVAEARRLGVPMWLGEYGSNMDMAGGAALVADHQDLLNERLLGGALWDWNPYTPHTFSPVGPGVIPKPTLWSFARPYPTATAGRLKSVSFDAATATLEVVFESDPAVAAGAATELALADDHWYPSGFTVECSDAAGRWSWAVDGPTGRLVVATDPAEPRHVIRVRPG